MSTKTIGGNSTFPSSFSVTINSADVARVEKRLNKWQGAELATRTQKAIQGGAALLVGPIRAGAAHHHITGKTEASVAVKKLRNRSGENAAYKVGVKAKNASSAWYAHFVIVGTKRGIVGDGYVDRAYEELGGEVTDFIDNQIIRLG
jgi:hypothetical protein